MSNGLPVYLRLSHCHSKRGTPPRKMSPGRGGHVLIRHSYAGSAMARPRIPDLLVCRSSRGHGWTRQVATVVGEALHPDGVDAEVRAAPGRARRLEIPVRHPGLWTLATGCPAAGISHVDEATRPPSGRRRPWRCWAWTTCSSRSVIWTARSSFTATLTCYPDSGAGPKRWTVGSCAGTLLRSSDRYCFLRGYRARNVGRGRSAG
jgi:hypothetical protein